ncbi:MAG: hypothetical protein ACRC1P_11020 [Cellulosilyticaceae bacterium]
MYSRELVRLMLQPTKVIHTKIEVLDRFDTVVDEIKGYQTDGSVSIDSSNMIRRSLNMSFVAHKTLEINNKSLLWINKRLRVYIGIEKYNKEIVYFNLGIYVISNPQTSISVDGRNISIQGYDKMKLYDQPFMFDTVFEPDTPIHEVIIALGKLVGETKFMVEPSEYTVPYKIQVSPTDKVENVLKDVTNLYMNYHTYYNVDGYLVFEKMKNRLSDPVVWEFDGNKDLTMERDIGADYDNIKNKIKVLGRMDDKTGIQPKYELAITDNSNDFSIDNIGERKMCVVEDKYSNNEQCQARAEFELDNVKNLINLFTINTAPIYLINDVNRVVTLKDNNKLYKCLVDKVDIPLSHNGLMNISCHEIFV